MFLSVWTPECDFYIDLSLIKVLKRWIKKKNVEHLLYYFPHLEKELNYRIHFKNKFNDIFQVL